MDCVGDLMVGGFGPDDIRFVIVVVAVGGGGGCCTAENKV